MTPPADPAPSPDQSPEPSPDAQPGGVPDGHRPHRGDGVLALGFMLPEETAQTVRDALATRLRPRLEARFPGVPWTIDLREEQHGDDTADALGLLEMLRDRTLEEEWDLAIALTAFPLVQGRHTLPHQVSTVHHAGVVALPRHGSDPEREAQEVVDHVVGAVSVLLGTSARGEIGPSQQRKAARRARQLATDMPEDRQRAPFYAARVIVENFHLLMSMILSSRPWALVVGLSRSVATALATGALTIVTSDLWRLSVAYSWPQMVVLSVISVVAVSVVLVVGAHLWERPRRPAEREHAVLFNVSTLVSVLIGVVVLHGTLTVGSMVGSYLMVHEDAFLDGTGVPLDLEQHLRLAWLVGGLSTIGSALGAGLEDVDVIRSAAYTRNGR